MHVTCICCEENKKMTCFGRLEGTSATQDECNIKDEHDRASIHNEKQQPQQ
jgi:hypothetical protein